MFEIDKKRYSMLLYIHIPYCDSKCHYCSFNSYVGKFETKSEYMQALSRQLEFELERFDAKAGDIESVFVGGGTPSTVDADMYAATFDLIAPYLQDNAEITTEANPNSASAKWLSGMRELGVNRVSFGVQSFDDGKLKALNRAHNSTQAKEAIINADKLGFEHISLDLIYNFQGDSKELLKSDIDQAFELPIDHLSAYELTIEQNTPFYATPQAKQDDEELAFWVAEEITHRGFEHYEISNFGKYQSRHNRGYWMLKDYIGIGAGAVGFRQNERYYPQTNIEAFIQDPLKVSVEHLSSNEILTEKIFLGLRSNIGIQQDILNNDMQQRAKIAVNEDKLTYRDGYFYNKNYFISDEIALYLLG